MKRHFEIVTFLASAVAFAQGATAKGPLVSAAGEVKAIPNWAIQSTAKVGDDLEALSSAHGGYGGGDWIDAPSSRCTVMGCLIAAGVYDDDDLWYSDNLKKMDTDQFRVPWIYRHEFDLAAPEDGVHYLLQIHGITSRADIYLNSKEVADKNTQAGSYGGHDYDITGMIAEKNTLVIQAHPTDYMKDFAMGFIDWNPAPPDNGTGVWRDVHIKQTGPASLGPIRALVDIDPGSVKLRTTVTNRSGKKMSFLAQASITEPSGGKVHRINQNIKLAPGEARILEFDQTFDKPQLWWPKQWGEQPLYAATINISTQDGKALSDTMSTKFGLRTVSSELSAQNDTTFIVNKEPFQVLGSGYSADMFMRFDPDRFEIIARYMLDMGLNTIRLEGKLEHPELHEICDRLGLMVMAGWECCNKWESFDFNSHIPNPDLWDEADHVIANVSMNHESLMLQSHPSLLTFLIGSDFGPSDEVATAYVDTLRGNDFQLPIISSAATKTVFPSVLPNPGLKMNGPYEWIPPNYWYDVDPDQNGGAAFGFGSELGAGVGTPELSSLRNFLSKSDLEDLWKHPDKGLYHMSTNVSEFYTRSVYNKGIWERYGEPESLDDYLLKVQVADYEAIRAQYEAFSANWNAERPATGLIYWMLNSAWPNLHWSQFDYYLHPAGSYFGTKTGARVETVAYNYVERSFYLVNHGLNNDGARKIQVDLIDLGGKTLASNKYSVETKSNTAALVGKVKGLEHAADVALLRFELRDGDGNTLSRNVHWVAPTVDELDWEESTWFHTPVAKYANYKSLFKMKEATVKTSISRHHGSWRVKLENRSKVPAFFIRLNLVDDAGEDVNPVTWSDNYVTLWPHEKMEISVGGSDGGTIVKVDGANVKATKVKV